MKKTDISKAVEIAYALKPKRQTGRTFHTVFGFQNGALVGIGINSYNKLHPADIFGKYKSIRSHEDNYKAGVHAEIDLLLNLGVKDCSDIEFLSLRVDNTFKLNNAKPCHNCMRVLKQIGFKKIYFSNKYGTIEKLN